MANKQTVDLIDQARALHARLGDYYRRLRHSAHDQRATILLDYLVDREQAFEAELKAYEASAPLSLMETWYQFTPAGDPALCLDERKFTPDVTTAVVVSEAMRLDNCLINFYRAIAEGAPYESVRDVFRDLLNVTMSRLRQFARDSQELEDW